MASLYFLQNKTPDEQHARIHVAQTRARASGSIISRLFKAQSCELIYGPSSLVLATTAKFKANPADTWLHKEGLFTDLSKKPFSTLTDTIIDLTQ